MTALEFFVEGHPQTAGSKSAIPGKGPNGRPLIVESGNRGAKRAWREDVREAARRAIREQGGEWPSADPMAVEFIFHRLRPKGHYGTGRNEGVLKASAPLYPTSRPDALKLARATEDALTAIVWADDAAIVDERLHKAYDVREGCTVRVLVLAQSDSPAMALAV